MLFETLLVEQRGPVTLLTLNRPHVLNALNDQVLRDLSAAFAAYSADDSQRCAVLTGSARAFAAGADIKEVATKAASELFLQDFRSEEHTSELQSLMRISYAVFCMKNKNTKLLTKTNA